MVHHKHLDKKEIMTIKRPSGHSFCQITLTKHSKFYNSKFKYYKTYYFEFLLNQGFTGIKHIENIEVLLNNRLKNKLDICFCSDSNWKNIEYIL